MNQSYSSLLKDPRWQRKRLEIFERDKWTCQICSDTESTLVVHHRLYLPKTAPWDYDNDLLVTLCECCHSNETRDIEEASGSISQIIKCKFYSNDIITLACGFTHLKLLHASEVVASAYELALKSKEIQASLIDKVFSHTDGGL